MRAGGAAAGVDRPAIAPAEGTPLRWAAGAAVGGLLLAGGATAVHPPLAALAPWRQGLSAIAGDPAWAAEHLALALGLILTLPGAALFHRVLRRRGGAHLSPLAGAALLLALPLWLVALSWELAVTPPLARLVAGGAAGGATLPEAVFRGAWAFPLLVGYGATALMWGAVTLWGVDVLRSRAFPRWWGAWGVTGGLAGLGGLPVGALVATPWAVGVLAATSGAAAAWLFLAARWMWEEGSRQGSPGAP